MQVSCLTEHLVSCTKLTFRFKHSFFSHLDLLIKDQASTPSCLEPLVSVQDTKTESTVKRNQSRGVARVSEYEESGESAKLDVTGRNFFFTFSHLPETKIRRRKKSISSVSNCFLVVSLVIGSHKRLNLNDATSNSVFEEEVLDFFFIELS